jgi:NADPH:quinone reductase-like Zn-dependent oxidoreductase
MVRFREVGGPEVLRIEEQPPKQPVRERVRLKVQAVGLNRAELMFIRDQYVEHPKLPGGLGYEAAGLVEAVGPDVDKSWIGKPVSTIPSFSMNEYAMLGEEVIAPVAALGEYPPNLSPGRRRSDLDAVSDGVWGADCDCACDKRRFLW